MKKFLLPVACLVLLSLCFSFSGCTSKPQISKEITKDFETITPEEAKTIMDENPHAVILDVRTKEEYDKGHIADSILLPNENIDEDSVSALGLTDNSVVLIYCRSGSRSKDAASKLAELGYSNIFDFGGINDWPYETEVSQVDK